MYLDLSLVRTRCPAFDETTKYFFYASLNISAVKGCDTELGSGLQHTNGIILTGLGQGVP